MEITRRDFLKSSLGMASAASLASTPLLTWIAGATPISASALGVATGQSPAENVLKAIKTLGGIEKFVKPGDRVFIKPNSISPLGPEYAINTHPDVIAEIARLCKRAGALQILALTHDEGGTWDSNGIAAALAASDGTIGAANGVDMYRRVNLPLGLLMRETMVINELLDSDVFINAPVAKHHAAAQLTLGMKNFMGLNWDRQIMHNTDLHQCIADLLTVRRPDLTIIDATRILLNNGPGGPGSVRETQSIIVSADPVAADSYAATLFKHEPRDIGHIRYAYEMGLGEIDLKRMDIRMA